MSKVKSNAEYFARLVEISQLINPQHGNREGKAFKNTQAKKGRVPQLDDAAGLNIEKVRQKVLEAKKPLTQVELNLIRNALEAWYQTRETNNTVARVVFHAIAAVFTVGLFHLGYLVARLFNKNLPSDSSKEVFSVFSSYKAMKEVGRFLKDTKGFKVTSPHLSFSAINQALDTTDEKPHLGNFVVNMAGLDEILLNGDAEEESTVEEEADRQEKLSERIYDSADDDSQSVSFNYFL